MKSIFSVTVFFLFSLLSAQEMDKIEKIKIGKYKYEVYLNENWYYEENKNFVNYILRYKNKEQFLGNYLTYRKTGSSKNYEEKIDESHPPDPRSLLKDGIILKEGVIDIDKERKEIIITEKKVYKDEGYEDHPDSVKRIYKQKKDGFFELQKLTNYKDGKETVVVEK